MVWIPQASIAHISSKDWIHLSRQLACFVLRLKINYPTNKQTNHITNSTLPLQKQKIVWKRHWRVLYDFLIQNKECCACKFYNKILYLDLDGMDPSNEYCANKQQGLKPPQETSCLFRFEPENKLPNKQTSKQTHTHTNMVCSFLREDPHVFCGWDNRSNAYIRVKLFIKVVWLNVF